MRWAWATAAGEGAYGKAAIRLTKTRRRVDGAITYLSETDDASETVRWIEDAGRRALALPGDLSNSDRCHEVMRRTVTELGLDLLVNNHAARERSWPFPA